MSFSVASCCMFCPPVSYAFATSAYWPIATVPSSCSAAAPICRPSLRHCSPRPWLSIAVNIAIAAPCDRWRSSPPFNFPLGYPTLLPPRILHDHRRPPPAHQPCLLPHSLWPNQTSAYCFNPAICDPSPIALSKTFALTTPASSLPTPLPRATYPAAVHTPTAPQPMQIPRLTTGDRTLVGFHQSTGSGSRVATA